MFRYIAVLLLRNTGIFLIVTFITFAVMYTDGLGVARSVLGLSASDEQVAAKAEELGLTRPLIVQYFEYLSGLVRGDLSASFLTGQPVSEALATRVPVTLSLIVITMIFTTVLAVVLGATAALYGGWVDRVLQFVSVLGAAVPGFIIAMGLIFAFAIAIPLYPATGYIPATDGIQGWLWSLTLPVISLLIGTIAASAAQFRGSVADTLSQDYVRTLRSRGVASAPLLFRHVLRNAAGPGLIVLSLTMLGLLGAALFIEPIFALPGIGQLIISAALAGDVPMVMGTVLFTTLLVIVVNIAADLSVGILNPKSRIR